MLQTRVWGNYLLEDRTEFGYAARRNRGSYTGQKIHRLRSAYIVSVKDEAAELALNHDTLGKRFLKNRVPVLFSCHPSCGCTQGQHAGRPLAAASADKVTCTKCRKGL